MTENWTLYARDKDEPAQVSGTLVEVKKTAHAFARATDTVVRCERREGQAMYVHPDGRVKYGNGDFA